MSEVGFSPNSDQPKKKKRRKAAPMGPDDKRKTSKGREANLIKWKPGQSGNPSGRPKKTALDHALTALLEEDVQEVVNPKGKLTVTGDMSVAEALARAAVQHAVKGSAKFAQLVAERTGGKPTENIHHRHSGDVVFTVRHIGSKGDAGNSSST